MCAVQWFRKFTCGAKKRISARKSISADKNASMGLQRVCSRFKGGRRQSVKAALQRAICLTALNYSSGHPPSPNSGGNIYLRVAVNAVEGFSAQVAVETGFGWCGILYPVGS